MRRVAIATLFLSSVSFTDSVNAQIEDKFKPEFHAGVLMHTYVGAQQKGYSQSSEVSKAEKWDSEATLYRARIMMEAQLSKKDYIFMETELTSPIGTGADKAASIKILDAQWDHKFCESFVVSAGKILVSHNRNGLQTASTLMANDFTYFQYPYNMSASSPLENDLGRDIGVGIKGYIIGGRLGYRAGAYAGRRTWAEETKPLRYVGRIEYNFLDIDKYSGTNLGEGKTFTIAGGFDTQGTYYAAGADVYIDHPVSESGSVTINGAYSYITGGDDATKKHNFSTLIPTQNTQFLELGYYFKRSRLQPWVKYERQNINSVDIQTGGISTDDFDKINSSTVYGAGLNYFFNGYTTNVRISYNNMKKGVLMGDGSIKEKSYSQVWLQLQLCLF